ncbi:MAG: hypothetical protein GY725_09805 [bacterium]|nr:hypothetical protein [bacterium]
MKRTNLALALLLASALSMGCYSGNMVRKGNVELHMGLSQREAVQRMIADPTAGERNTRPVSGIDAPTAAGVMDNYHRNERAETQDKKVRDRSLRSNR